MGYVPSGHHVLVTGIEGTEEVTVPRSFPKLPQ
jgi:hypothetical protein